MPTYEYVCQKCGYEFEQFQSMRDAPLKKCPKCKKAGLKRLVGGGAGLIFKGSGFYITDYKNKSGGSKEGDGAKESGGTKEGGGTKESGGASKPTESKTSSDAKPSTAPSSSGSSSASGKSSGDSGKNKSSK